MSQTLIKNVVALCKTIMRNGYDAYVINAPLQHKIISTTHIYEVDIACAAPEEELLRLFPALKKTQQEGALGILTDGELTYHFYPTDVSESSPPQLALTRITPTILQRLRALGPLPLSLLNPYAPAIKNDKYGFEPFTSSIRFEGVPDETIWRNNILGVRALRYAANLDLPIDPSSWVAIIRASQRILDYVPTHDIMDEWRKVAPESMWRFVELLYESQLLHGLIPELAALALLRQSCEDGGEESILKHTIASMKAYPENEFAYDWYGTMAVLFHDVGKIATAEYEAGKWTFYQHHLAGAKMTRTILRRLHMSPEHINLICHLVKNHMHFHFMMTDKGIRRFMARGETPRLIQMAKADVIAHEDNYTAFNHNMKYLSRAQTPEQMLEPFLNGNEIMEHTGLKPGPHVGTIRDALLRAQVAGDVLNNEDAVAFVCAYAKTM